MAKFNMFKLNLNDLCACTNNFNTCIHSKHEWLFQLNLVAAVSSRNAN